MIWRMAWRNIWRNKLRSVLIMLSVSVGLFCGMMALALYKGMLSGRIKTVIGFETGNLQLHHPSFKDDYAPLLVLSNLKKLNQVILALPGFSTTALRSVTMGMLATTTGSAGVQIMGIDPQVEVLVSGLDKKIVGGFYFKSGQNGRILIGKKLADKVKLKVGQKLVLTFTDAQANLISSAYRVMGIFQTENASLDERLVYIRRNELNNLLGINQAAHEQVILLDGDDATLDAQKILQSYFPELLVETWSELSPETKLMVDAVDVYSSIIMVIILIALSFGIINTMLMAVLERTREFGMMMALGLNKLKLFLLITLETLILTVAGSPLGLWLAWLYSAYLNKVGIDWSGKGEEMMSSFGFNAVIYPEFPMEKVGSVLGIVVVTAIVSCFFPAARALQLQPTDALRK